MNSSIIRALAVVASVGVVALSGAGPAAAESRGQNVSVNGTWKAYGQYDDENNQICSRAYNSVSGARSVVWVAWNGGQTANVLDNGGDENRTCGTFNGLDGKGPGRLNVQFVTSTGATYLDSIVINDL
jgi:hypothetical protein